MRYSVNRNYTVFSGEMNVKLFIIQPTLWDGHQQPQLDMSGRQESRKLIAKIARV